MILRHALSNRPFSWSKLKVLSRHNGFLHYLDRPSSTSSAGSIRLAAEVAEAKSSNKPIVALESTIITHGMPYPENIKTAQMVENIVRQNGAVPATVAVIDGQIHAGLSDEQLQRLGEPGKKTIKTSRRDLPYVISQGLTGGTTVSGTMIAAQQAGIHVFVTGGVGGVHRGAETTLDISADLTELGRTPIAVVSAGVKSILDIGLTLEYLETQGVCVTTFGETTDFPAFFTPKSGYHSPYNVDSAKTAAQLIDANLSLSLGNGILIAVPIPPEEAAVGAEIEQAIQIALAEAKESSISGKEVTPFILARVNELTEGKSLAANIALIRNNARVGSQIAVELAKQRSQVQRQGEPSNQQKTASRGKGERSQKPPAARPVVIGGINVDFTARFKHKQRQPNGATYPGDVLQTFGGVGRNLASCLGRFGNNPLFLSAMGRDNFSDYFFQEASHMDLSGVRRIDGMSSAMYCAVLEADGELLYGIGGFDAHKQITPEYVKQYVDELSAAPLVAMDGNMPEETISYIADICHDSQVPVFFETSDQHLTTKPLRAGAIKKLTYVSPNMNELRIMNAYIRGKEAVTKASNSDVSLSETLGEALELVPPLLELVPNVLVTLGEYGAMLVTQEGERGMAYHCPARPAHVPPPVITSVSGAGDCLAAGFMSYLIAGQSKRAALKAGVLASQLSLPSHHAVPVTMSADVISPDAVAALEPWTIQEISL